MDVPEPPLFRVTLDVPPEDTDEPAIALDAPDLAEMAPELPPVADEGPVDEVDDEGPVDAEELPPVAEPPVANPPAAEDEALPPVADEFDFELELDVEPAAAPANEALKESAEEPPGTCAKAAVETNKATPRATIVVFTLASQENGG